MTLEGAVHFDSDFRHQFRVYLFSDGWFYHNREFPGTEFIEVDTMETSVSLLLGIHKPRCSKLSQILKRSPYFRHQLTSL